MSLVVALVIASLAVVFDLRRGIVPNWLMLVGLLAVLVSIAITGEPTWFKALLAAAIMVVVWLPVWAGGAIGGGDHKLLIVVGAAVGIANIIVFLLAMAIAGGIQAVVCGIARKNWNFKQQRIPYTIAILVGVLICYVYNNFVGISLF